MAIKLRTLSSKIRKPVSPRSSAASDFLRCQKKKIISLSTALAFTSQPQNKTVDEYSLATFSCEVTGGVAPYIYQWKKGGVNVGTNSAALSFTAAVADNGASIAAVVTDSAGTVIESSAATISILDYRNVVVIGASIIQNSFGRDLVTPNTAATNYLGIDGVNVYGYGWSGYTIETLMDKISEAFAAFPDNDTLFIIHAGGNNTTATIPYVTATVSALEAFDTALTNMYSLISSRTDDCIVADLTFRDYDDECVYNQELGALPFITNLYAPKRLAKWTNTDGRSVVDFYTYIRNNYALALSSDNVHMTPSGEDLIMKFPLDRIRYLFNGGSMPAPIPDTIPEYVSPVGGAENNIIVNFGSDNLNSGDLFTGVKVRSSDFVAGNVMPLTTVSGESTPYTMSFTAQAFSGGAITLGSNVNGVDLGGTFANTLMSNPIHRESLWWSPTDLVKVKILGFTPGQTVELSFVGTRVTGTARYTEMIDVSNPTNLVAYPTSNTVPVDPVTLTLTANASGEVEVQFDAQSGTSYTYLGGLKVNPI